VDKDESIVLENSRSVAFSELPNIPKEFDNDKSRSSKYSYGTILLFYQYKEPVWTKKEHKKALKTVIEIGAKFQITGRGRIAPEGLNCTLSGNANDVRSFCYALREWSPLFHQTDFKLTDGIPRDKLFKSLSIRKTEELVAYGLKGEKAPSIEAFAGKHLEAYEYHKAMAEPDTVIVDVRNAYESAIGNFQPPKGGAKLIDPKIRNSIEFPKWLHDPKTQQQLHGKKVLMYCTGGIRCERATALLNQMTAANPDSLYKPKEVYELRGGIERYIKTFPKGGFWTGKNYLFDRRMEQLPKDKSQDAIEKEVDSKCCLCRKHWTIYRGKFKCAKGMCGVPVIVCKSCESAALANPKQLTCELCKTGYKSPEAMPDLVGQKRKAESSMNAPRAADGDTVTPVTKKSREKKATSEQQTPLTTHNDRLFLARLPLTVTLTKLRDALQESNSGNSNILIVHWLADKATNAFYGSCVVQFESPNAARNVVDRAEAKGNGGIKIDKKRIKISKAVVRRAEVWPPTDFVQSEFPPVG